MIFVWSFWTDVSPRPAWFWFFSLACRKLLWKWREWRVWWTSQRTQYLVRLGPSAVARLIHAASLKGLVLCYYLDSIILLQNYKKKIILLKTKENKSTIKFIMWFWCVCVGEKNENKREAEEATRTGAQYG